MRVEDGAHESGEALLEFLAAGGVADFDAVTLAADESVFAQDFEVLRERGFGNGLFADGEKAGAVHRAALSGDVGVDGDPDGVGEGVKDTFDGDVLDRRVKQGPHACETNAGIESVQ